MRPKAKERKGDLFGALAGPTSSRPRLRLLPLALSAVGALAVASWLMWTATSPPPTRPTSSPASAVSTPEPSVPSGPRVAIVIDDLGVSLKAAQTLLGIPQPLTFAVLPKLTHSREIAEAAAAAGRDVLLHLPMEPLDYPEKDPGPGALFKSMTSEAMVEVLKEDLAAVPKAVGVNNHMGSRLTEDEEVMRLILTMLKERRLFFLDSYTSPRSVVSEVARELGVPTASRHVFLDHEPEGADYVAAQIDRLIAVARRHGEAIGIGHPRPSTIAALQEHLPKLAEAGITVVPLSTLIAAR
ncbi:MAG: divergent polysaccharide deacetylase family protein [bacterium]